MDYTEISLDSEAIKYIRECLLEGNTLAHYILENIILEDGRVVTFLPSNVSLESSNQFKTGGKVLISTKCRYMKKWGVKWKMEPIPNVDFYLITMIEKFLMGEGRKICIFEDAFARLTDPWLSHYKGKFFTFKDEVYHLLEKEDREKNKIKQTIRKAYSIPIFIGIMTSEIPEDNLFIEKGKEVSAENLRIFAERTEKIIIGAYDGEGSLIWENMGILGGY